MLPRVALIRQSFPRPVQSSISAAIAGPIGDGVLPRECLQDKSIAIGVGSRGIAALSEIVRATVDALKDAGARPFIFPSMGSHGCNIENGQRDILAEYGVTEAAMGVPIVARTETVEIDPTPDGIPVHFDRAAFEADGIIVINRVKQHTDFEGALESGLCKMIVIGLGKNDGASACHSWTSNFPYDHIIRTVTEAKLATGKIIGGVAVIENAYHECAQVEVVPAHRIIEREMELLGVSKALTPRLPVEKADFLVVDEMGKDISGAGMDPKIIGRKTTINTVNISTPEIVRVAVLDLTEGSKGNIAGLGNADICSCRVVEKMRFEPTHNNALSSRNLAGFKIPIHFPTDREVLMNGLRSLGDLYSADNLRLLRIRNTLTLDAFWASEPMLEELREHERVESISDLYDITFDQEGNLPKLTSLGS